MTEQAVPQAVTIDDVAAEAGLSRSTVSRALGGYGHVSTQAREKIETAAQKLGYSVNMAAKSTRTGRSMTLGLIVADLAERFFSEVTRGFSDVAKTAGYQVILANTDDDPDEQENALRALLQSRVDGLAIAPAQTPNPESAQQPLTRTKVPIVAIDRRIPHDRADVVLLNSEEAARTAVTHLLSQGHTRIGMVTGLSANPEQATDLISTSTTETEAAEHGSPATPTDGHRSPGTDRIHGYLRALSDFGVTPSAGLILRTPRTLENATNSVVDFLRRPDRPTALFASDELHALACLLAAGKLGLEIPTDLSIVGIDDPDWAAAVSTPLSVVAQPSYELGKIAAQRLLERIDGDKSDPREDVMNFAWVPRDSIAAPRHQ